MGCFARIIVLSTCFLFVIIYILYMRTYFFAELIALPGVYLAAPGDCYDALTRDPDSIAYFSHKADCFVALGHFCNHPLCLEGMPVSAFVIRETQDVAIWPNASERR